MGFALSGAKAYQMIGILSLAVYMGALLLVFYLLIQV